MIKTVLFLLLTFSVPALAVVSAPKIETGKYSLDATHSKIGFDVGHLVISSVEGRFNDVSGDIEMGKKIEDTKISAKIDVKSVSTGNADRDHHLTGPDFFDVAKFPEMTFVSKAVSGKSDALKIKGDLTVHGVTKPVTLDGKYSGVVADMYGNDRVAFVANGKISRKEFGLTWNKAVEAGPVVGDEVSLQIKIEAAKPAKK